MSDKISELFELQLFKLLKTTEKKNNIKYNDLFNYINRDLLSLKTIKLEKEKNNSVLISNKLDYLINQVPDFIIRNKTLTEMTRSFIKICNNDNIDTSSLNEETINSMLISWLENNI